MRPEHQLPSVVKYGYCITEMLFSIHDVCAGGFFQCHLRRTYEGRGALDKLIASSGEQQSI